MFHIECQHDLHFLASLQTFCELVTFVQSTPPLNDLEHSKLRLAFPYHTTCPK